MLSRRWLETLTAVAAWAIGSSSVAQAQLPLPNLEGPEVRFASSDPLADRLQALADKVQKRLDARTGALEAAAAETEEADGTDAADSLASALRREVVLLEQARRRTQEGLALLEVAVAESVQASFEEVVEASQQLEQLESLSEQREAQARRLEALAKSPRTVTATTGRALRLAEEAIAVQAAEADASLAEALRTRAELRVADARVAVLGRALVVAPASVERARKKLQSALDDEKKAQARLGRTRHKLSDVVMGPEPESDRARYRRRVAETELELAVRAVENARARAVRARVELVAQEALSVKQPPNYPADLTPNALAALLAEVAEARLEAEARLSELRMELRGGLPRNLEALGRRIREGLEDVLASLVEERDAIAGARRLQRILSPPEERVRSVREWVTALALTLLVVAAAALLLMRGLPALQALEAKIVPTEAKKARQTNYAPVLAGVLVAFPVLVVAGAAALVAWPIWGLSLTMAEALSAVDRPLFYVDEHPISVAAIAKLIFTVWITLVLSRLVRSFLVTRVFPSLSIGVGFSSTVSTFVHYLFLAVGLMVGLRFVGVGLSSFALLAGVLGIGIGFGLRNIAENFISGLIVLVERPIQVGDWIDMDGKVEGQVKSIRARSTTVRTRDNVAIIIPNNEFVARQVTNWSHQDPKVRLQISVGVAYGSDADLVRRTLLEVAERHGRVLERPSPEVQFKSFGSSSLDFLLLVWIEDQVGRYRIQSDLRFAIDAAFGRKGIVIAFPQLDVHVRTLSPEAARVFVDTRPSVESPPDAEVVAPPTEASRRERRRETAKNSQRTKAKKRLKAESLPASEGGAKPEEEAPEIAVNSSSPSKGVEEEKGS